MALWPLLSPLHVLHSAPSYQSSFHFVPWQQTSQTLLLVLWPLTPHWTLAEVQAATYYTFSIVYKLIWLLLLFAFAQCLGLVYNCSFSPKIIIYFCLLKPNHFLFFFFSLQIHNIFLWIYHIKIHIYM